MVKKKQVEIIAIALFVVTFLTFFSISFFKQPLTITGYAIYTNQSNETYAKDTYIKENPVINYGEASTMKMGKTAGGDDYRALLEFNLSSVPSGDTIVLAKLQIYVESADNTGNVTLKLYNVTSGWDETATNWTYRTASEIWWSGGGDYDSTTIDIINVSNSSGVYYNFTITSLVSNWLANPSNNKGLIIIAPDAINGEIIEISSSGSTTAAQRPLIYVDHSPNAAPTINNLSTDTSLTNPKNVGESATFTINWTDLEGTTGQIFICNTSEADSSGCTNGTFCNNSLALTNPASCSYTITTNDNRTTNFWAFISDGNNCSDANASQFYVNHLPTVGVNQPNGGETINQSASGNYTIQFNMSDADSDNLNASLYYGVTQNSPTNIIATINLNSTYCTDPDSDTSTTPNNCQYSWNTNNVYGIYYLIIIINDSYSTSNDSSDSSFNVVSLQDNAIPNITAQWLESGTIYSGRQINFYANASDDNINTVWISINRTSQTNYTMSNSSGTYNYTWTADAVGNYTFKVWANDTLNNINNSMSWTSFNVTKPNATNQSATGPSTALPYHAIQITGQLNATDPLRNVYAYLNVPDGFVFLSNYSQNTLMGNFTADQTKTATWFVATPITESTYSLNITYTDNYNNQWNSSNIQVQVTSAVGGGYEISMAGYPEVETSDSYFAQAYFKQSGTYTNPDSISIDIYDASGSQIVGPVAMTQESTGIYNYSYTVGASATEGQWETIVNATKSGISYYDHEFWKVVGGPFDVRTITIIDAVVPDLNISFIAENTGGANKDLILNWNLTREDTGVSLNSGSETRMVPANSQITWYINATTTYVGQVRITLLGYYSETEKAGAYKIFSTTSGEEPTPTPSPGGGGGGGTTMPTKVKPISQVIFQNLEDEIYLTKNIEKTIEIILNNTGENNLNKIVLSISGLTEEEYEIQPNNIDKLKVEDTKKIKTAFLITDFVGEKDVQFKLTSNELNKTQNFKLIVVSTKEFFLKEIDRLTGKVNILKSILGDENLIDNLRECEDIIGNIEKAVEKEEYINARDYLDEAEKCIDKVQEKAGKKPLISFEGMGIWIIAGGLILLIIIIFIVLIYILLKKVNIMNFMNRVKTERGTEQRREFTKVAKENIIKKRLERIKSKISNDQKNQPASSLNKKEEQKSG